MSCRVMSGHTAIGCRRLPEVRTLSADYSITCTLYNYVKLQHKTVTYRNIMYVCSLFEIRLLCITENLLIPEASAVLVRESL